MTLATGPTLSCSSGYAPVAVIAFNGILPVQNAQVTILSTYSIMGIILDSKRHDLTTNIMGLAQVCEENRLTRSYAVEAWIQKSNVDFGSGTSNPHHVGTVTGLIRATTPFTIFRAVAAPTIPPIPPAPPIPDVCTAWETAATVSLPNQLNPLSTIVNIYNAKWNCPNLNTSELISGVGRLKIGRFSTNFNISGGLAFFDLKDKLSLSALLSSLIGIGNTNVEILIPNKDTGYTTFTKSILVPSEQIPDICTTWDTVATPNVPATMATTFPITVAGAKWVCKDFDDAKLISGMGKIEIGGSTFDFPIQNGYGRVNLENLMDLSTFTGIPAAPTVPTIPTVPIVPETIIPPNISPYEPGSSTITLYLNDYVRNKIYTPIRGAYWGAGHFSRSAGYYNIHKANDARGTGDKYPTSCKLNRPKTIGEYTVTVLSIQNLGLENASYTVKIKL